MSGLTPQYIRPSGERSAKRKRLEAVEEEMRLGLRKFASNLETIRSDRLWMGDEKYTSFDDYCHKKLGFSEQRASQLITGLGTLKGLEEACRGDEKTMGKIEMLPEKVLRQVRDVPPKKALAAIKKVSSKGRVTAKKIAVELGQDYSETPVKCPHCGKSLSRSQSTDNDDDEMP